jgi:ComF family protein
MTTPAIAPSQNRLRPAYQLYRWAWAGLDLVYPPICGGCGSPGARWCLVCQGGVEQVQPPICEICGQNLVSGRRCRACQDFPPAFTELRAYAAFAGPLRNAMHRLKYNGDMAMGEILARPLVRMLKTLAWPVDLVTPVPLSPARQAKRGYNQAALLAWPLALSSGIPYRPKVLEKIRETRSQVGLTVEQRQENVRAAFVGKGPVVRDKIVLVVDDIATSGATMQACARALLDAGACQAYGLTLARAVFTLENFDDLQSQAVATSQENLAPVSEDNLS